jgi:hypothetical protein
MSELDMSDVYGRSLFAALQFVQAKRAYASPNSGFLCNLAELELDLHVHSSLDSRALLMFENDRFISAALLRCSLHALPVESNAASTINTADSMQYKH